MNRPGLSLKWLIPLVLLLLAVAHMLATFGYLLPQSEKRGAERQTIDIVAAVVDLQGTLETFLRLGHFDGVRREVSGAATDPRTKWLLVVDDHDDVMAATDFRWVGRPVADTGLPVDAALLAKTRNRPGSQAVAIRDGETLLAYCRVGLDGEGAELRSFRGGAIILAWDLSHANRETRRQALESVAALSLLTLAGIVAAGLSLHFLLTRRVTGLLATVTALSTGTLTARSRVTGRDEVGALGAAFDRMADMLQARMGDLQNSEMRFRSLFDNSPVALWEEDFSAVKGRVDGLAAAGVTDLQSWLAAHPEEVEAAAAAVRVVAVNRAAVRLHEAGNREDLLRNLPRTFGKRSYADFAREMLAIAEGKTFLEMDSEVLTLDGERRLVTVLWAVPPGSEETYDRVLVSLVDVTEVRKTQADLLARTQELERSNEELEQFAHVASHDLRQPVRTVISYLSLIEKKFGPQLSEEMRKYLAFASDGARRMDALIVDLLDYSTTMDKSEPFEPVRLADAVSQSLLGLAAAINDSGARIEVSEALPTLSGSMSELIRLFQNLIANAIKYRQPSSPPEIHIGCRDNGGEWLVWVQDNGIGIAPEQREKAFGIFQRLVPKESIEGSGIGLTICKKVVMHHNGRIWIEDSPGGGCTILMVFPK